MARKELVNQIIKLYQKLGGNVSDVLGTKTNVSFIGKGEPDILKMDLNTDALGALPQSKAIEELKDSVQFAAGDKLNDLQASKLLENMSKMNEFYNPPAAPANITDLATGVKNLDKEGLMSLRKDNVPFPEVEDYMSAPTGAGLEAIKSVKNNSLIVDDLVDKVYQMSGVAENAKPVARANARDFLNRVKDLEDPEFPGGTTLSSVMEPDDLKFATEGGGGGLGDPLLLVQKYFGPKVAGAVAKLDSPNDIQEFAENLVKIKDAKGNSVTSRYFDPESISFDDFEFAEGGRVPMFAGGAARIGYQALRKYGIEAKDISRLFASLGSDKSLVGKEKTEYFRNLHKVLKNPDDYPDGIREIQIRLGIDIPGLKSGGLAGILEV